MRRGTDAYVTSLAQRYERALSEYEGATRDLVAQGFLIPMFLGQLDAQTAATNWEHTAPVWREKLESLGWRVTRLQHLSDYFWALAFVLVTEAHPTRRAGSVRVRRRAGWRFAPGLAMLVHHAGGAGGTAGLGSMALAHLIHHAAALARFLARAIGGAGGLGAVALGHGRGAAGQGQHQDENGGKRLHGVYSNGFAPACAAVAERRLTRIKRPGLPPCRGILKMKDASPPPAPLASPQTLPQAHSAPAHHRANAFTGVDR